MSERVRVDKLICDMERYVRGRLPLEHVQRIGDAIDAGIGLPPVIVWKGRWRIVDGYCRVKAVELATNGRGQIAIVQRDYADEAAVLIDAVRLNAAQGLSLCDADRQRTVLLAEGLHVDPARLAQALSVTTERYGQLQLGRRPAVASDLQAGPRRPEPATSVAPGQTGPSSTRGPIAVRAPLLPAALRSASSTTARPAAPVRVPVAVVLATDTLIEFLDRVDAPYSDPRLFAGLVRLKGYLDRMPKSAAVAAVAGQTAKERV